MSSLHSKLEELFHRTMDLPLAERDAFAREVEDVALRDALLEALAEAHDPSAFLATPLPDLMCATVDVPRTIGGYRILGLLGAGGMGRVFLAEQDRPRRRIALKLAHESELTDEGARRFAREAELLGRIVHPGVARVLEAGTQSTPRGRFAFIAMEFVDGEPLSTTPPRSPREAAAIAEKLARALATCHAAGVVHRDLKPGNVMVRSNDDVVLVDFGIARELVSEETAMTRTGSFLGTPSYMSPEQIRGETVDHRSDIWSLGVILHELATGARPFAQPTQAGLIDAILRRAPIALDRSRGRAWRELDAVLSTCLAKNPGDRYSDAELLAEDLARLVRGAPVSVRVPGPFGRARAWARMNPGLSLSLAVAVLLGLVAAGAVGFLASRWGEIESGRAALEGRRADETLELAWLEFSDGHHEDAVARLTRAMRDAAPATSMSLRNARDAMNDLAAAGTEDAPRSTDPAFTSYVRAVQLLIRGRSGESEAMREARAAFDQAIVHAPEPRALYHIGRLWALKESGTREEIAAAVAFIESRFPESVVARAATAAAFLRVDPRESVARYRAALERRPDEPVLVEGLAHAMMRAGDLASATAAARDLVAKQPDTPRFKTALANFITMDTPTEEALVLARAGLVGRADDVQALSVLADIEMRLGRPADALAHYRAVFALAPRRSRTLEKIATLERGAGRLEESAEFFARACALAPTPSLHADRGGVLLALGRLDEAVAACREALALDPDSRAANLNCASALQLASRPREAIHRARAALTVDPACAEAWLIIGLANSRLQRHRAAVEAFEEADAIGTARGAWRHPTEALIEAERQRIGMPPPRWFELAEAAGSAAAAGRHREAAASLEAVAAHIEQELDEDRCDARALLERLTMLDDDARLANLRDEALLARLDAGTETALRRVFRTLDALNAEAVVD